MPTNTLWDIERDPNWEALVGRPAGGRPGSGGFSDPDFLGRITDARKRNVVPKAHPEGLTDYYDDSWKILSEGLGAGRGVDQILGDVLKGFKGKPGNLEDFLKQASPFLGAGAAGQIKGTAGFKHLDDPANWDMGALASFQPAAGAMARGSAQGLQAGTNQLAAAGLGRSGARASLRQQAAQNLAGQQGDLWSRVFQQSQQNRMQSALNNIDAHRTVAQIALGMAPTPRTTEQGQGGGGDWLSGLLGAAGAFGGLAGGIGSLVGALGGGGSRR